MNQFFGKKVDKRSRKEMEKYLKEHFRYDDMGCQRPVYANNVKLLHMELTEDERRKAYELIDAEGFYDQFLPAFAEFECLHKGWKLSFDGRSNGYITLERKNDRMLAWQSAMDDPSDYTMEELRDTASLVEDFDKACDEMRNITISLTKHCRAEEEYYTVLKMKRVLYRVPQEA